MILLGPKKEKGPNKQGGWKIPQDEISGGGGRKFGLAVQQPARIQ